MEVMPNADRAAEARQLIDAFQIFTEASSSLEIAFQQLQNRARRLSEELTAKNRQLKKSLKEREVVKNYLRRILESLPCGVIVRDHAGAITLCNPMARQILGYAETREPGRGGAVSPRRAGERQLEEYLDMLSCAGSEGKEVEVPLVSGGMARTLAVSSSALTASDGTPLGCLHILRDVTEIKELQEQGKRIDKLSAMGEMAVELAHEIRNPLGSIELFASLLEQELPRGSDQGRWAENIRIGSRSLNNIVSNMLHFAHPLTPDFQEVDLHVLVDEIIEFTAPILRQREIRIELACEAAYSAITGDRELLRQMLLNLVLNALQAMPSRGLLRLETRTLERLPGGICCGGIELSVRDNGLGIPEGNLSRIFDPFFTTNRNGTGLGLSVVHQIVDQHSGFIRVESKVNAGTSFMIAFPRVPPGQND